MSLAAYTSKTWTDYADSPCLEAVELNRIDSGIAAVTAELLALEAALPTTYQPISAELSALAALSSTGYAKRTGAAAWSMVPSIPQSDVAGLTTALAGKEPALGSPGTTGYLLSSTAAGVRSWVAPYTHPATHQQSVVDSASGWITAALAGKQASSSVLTSMAAQSSGTGLLKLTAGVASLDSTAYLPLSGGALVGPLSSAGYIVSNVGSSDALASSSRIGMTSADFGAGWLLSYSASGAMRVSYSAGSQAWSSVLSISTAGVISRGAYALWDAGNLTNLSQLTNGPGYITAASLPLASTTTPSALGAAAVGIGTTWARADHVHTMPTPAQVGALAVGAQAADSAKLGGLSASYFVQGTSQSTNYGVRTTLLGTGSSANANINQLTPSGFFDGRFLDTTQMPQPGWWTFSRIKHSDPTGAGAVTWGVDFAGAMVAENVEQYCVRVNTGSAWGTWRTLWHTGNLTGDQTAHSHSYDRDRANHTGVQAQSTVYAYSGWISDALNGRVLTNAWNNQTIVTAGSNSAYFADSVAGDICVRAGHGGTVRFGVYPGSGNPASMFWYNASQVGFGVRPTFNGFVPWDAGNLVGTRNEHNHAGVYLPLSGGTMAGDINLGGYSITSGSTGLGNGMVSSIGGNFTNLQVVSLLAATGGTRINLGTNLIPTTDSGVNLGQIDKRILSAYSVYSYLSYLDASVEVAGPVVRWKDRIVIGNGGVLPIVGDGCAIIAVGQGTGGVTNKPTTNSYQAVDYRKSDGTLATAAAGGNVIDLDLYGRCAFVVGVSSSRAQLIV